MHPRLAHSLKKVLGEYYFVRMPQEKLKTALKECYYRNDEIKSDDQIADFIAKEQLIRDPLDTLQYKFIFVPDFSATQSLIVLKMAHCLCDGITTMALTSTLADGGYNPENFPKLTPRMSFP